MKKVPSSGPSPAFLDLPDFPTQIVDLVYRQAVQLECTDASSSPSAIQASVWTSSIEKHLVRLNLPCSLWVPDVSVAHLGPSPPQFAAPPHNMEPRAFHHAGIDIRMNWPCSKTGMPVTELITQISFRRSSISKLLSPPLFCFCFFLFSCIKVVETNGKNVWFYGFAYV